MQSDSLARGYAALVGVVLVFIGLLGFLNNPIVGDAGNNPLFVTGSTHNVVHLFTGAVALFVAFGLAGGRQATGVIAFGVLYLLIFVALLISPNLFGLLLPVSVADHALHFGVGIVSVGVGMMARANTASMTR
jgi:hypothetical protein